MTKDLNEMLAKKFGEELNKLVESKKITFAQSIRIENSVTSNCWACNGDGFTAGEDPCKKCDVFCEMKIIELSKIVKEKS